MGPVELQMAGRSLGWRGRVVLQTGDQQEAPVPPEAGYGEKRFVVQMVERTEPVFLHISRKKLLVLLGTRCTARQECCNS